MNASALRRIVTEDSETVSVMLPLSAFNREHAVDAANKRARSIGIGLAVAVHVLLIGGFLVAGPSTVKQLPQELLMVSVLPQEQVAKVDLPPPPKLEQVVQPQVEVPDITIEVPAPMAISVAPPKPVVTDSTPVSASDSKSYFSRIFAMLLKNKRYPEAARIKREKGIAVVRMVLERSGAVAGVTLVKSSGSESLDQEAVNLPMRIQPLPAMPPSITQDRLTLTFNVDFTRAN